MSLKPKILVTGAAQMVGATIVKDLITEGHSLRVLKNDFYDYSHLNEFEKSIEFVNSSLLDVVSLEVAMQGIDQIYHCEEFVSFLAKDKQKLIDINITGTRNIVNQALTTGVKKVLFMSSTMAFGTYKFKKTISENTKWQEHNDNNFYSVSKHFSELEIYRGEVEGLETLIVNPSLIIGDAIQENDMYNLVNIAKAHYRFYPNGVYGFIHLADVSKAIIALMGSDFSGEKFLLNSENLKYKTVLEFLNPELKKSKLFKRINSTKVNLIWRMNELMSLLFNDKSFLSKEIYNFNGKEFEFNNSKIIEKIGFGFEKIV